MALKLTIVKWSKELGCIIILVLSIGHVSKDTLKNEKGKKKIKRANTKKQENRKKLPHPQFEAIADLSTDLKSS